LCGCASLAAGGGFATRTPCAFASLGCCAGRCPSTSHPWLTLPLRSRLWLMLLVGCSAGLTQEPGGRHRLLPVSGPALVCQALTTGPSGTRWSARPDSGAGSGQLPAPRTPNGDFGHGIFLSEVPRRCPRLPPSSRSPDDTRPTRPTHKHLQLSRPDRPRARARGYSPHHQTMCQPAPVRPQNPSTTKGGGEAGRMGR
jgi:hypothetical protein